MNSHNVPVAYLITRGEDYLALDGEITRDHTKARVFHDEGEAQSKARELTGEAISDRWSVTITHGGGGLSIAT